MGTHNGKAKDHKHWHATTDTVTYTKIDSYMDSDKATETYTDMDMTAYTDLASETNMARDTDVYNNMDWNTVTETDKNEQGHGQRHI